MPKKRGRVDTALQILNEVKQVKPQQWRNPQHVDKMARTYLDKLGIAVPEERLKQFMSAYEEALKNGSGTEELIQKYGNKTDPDTVDALKKYLPKWK